MCDRKRDKCGLGIEKMRQLRIRIGDNWELGNETIGN